MEGWSNTHKKSSGEKTSYLLPCRQNNENYPYALFKRMKLANTSFSVLASIQEYEQEMRVMKGKRN